MLWVVYAGSGGKKLLKKGSNDEVAYKKNRGQREKSKGVKDQRTLKSLLPPNIRQKGKKGQMSKGFVNRSGTRGGVLLGEHQKMQSGGA